MKGHKLHRILLMSVMLFCMAGSFSWAKDDWDQQATRRKAEYVFLEAMNAFGTEDYDRYTVLLNNAYNLDTTDIELAGEWGLLAFADPDVDSVTAERAYANLRTRFLAYPDNYTNGLIFAGIAQRYRKFDDLVMAWELIDSLFPAYETPAQELASAYLMQYLRGDTSSYPKAIDIYNRLESGAGKTLPLASQKIRAFFIKKDTMAVVRELDEILASAPDDSYAALFAGSNYEYMGDNERALQYYGLACQLDSANGNAYMARANLYRELGDSVSFDREVFHALMSQNLDVEPKLQILRGYVSMLYTDTLQEGRIRQLFSTLETQHPGEPEINNLYAAYLYEIGDFKGAAEQMGYSVALDPTSEAAWSTLVRAQYEAGDTVAMINTALTATERFPDNLYFPINASDGYRQINRLDQALAVLDSVHISNVENEEVVSRFYGFRGDLKALAGDTAAALQSYEQAIQINPYNLMAMNNAAYYMAENDIDLDRAEQYISRVIRVESENPTYLDTYAWVAFKKRDYTLAKQYIDMTMNLCNAGVTNQEEVVETQEGDGDDDEVVEFVDVDETIIEISAEIYDHAGDIYFMNGDRAKALEFWKEALKLEPDNQLIAKKVKHKTIFFK